MLASLLLPARADAEPRRWRLDRSLGLPAWLELELEHRLRAELLAHDYRASAGDGGAGLSARTTLRAQATRGLFVGGLELEDARFRGTGDVSPNTTLVNTVELLQAYVGLRTDSAFADKDHLEVRAGRLTIDLGSRRLVARNRFRNTINGFTGVDATWTSPSQHVARAFVAIPVTRRPTDAAALEDNAIELDQENTDTLLWAAAYGSPALAWGTRLELYGIGLHERDGELASRNRQLLTLGARWSRKPAPGTWDFEVEVMPQLGRARATAAADDTTDLAHRAFSSHVELGATFAHAWHPRVAVLHDYATGDRDPADDASERFDPLFGSRRADVGPTGIYGAFARVNIQSPGVRLSFAPSAKLDAFATGRLYWLASRTDAWSPGGLADPTGASGSFIGTHVEGAIRWSPVPDNLSIEVGAALLHRGRFARTAAQGSTADPAYAYVQLTLHL